MKFLCPHCEQKIEADDDLGGMEISCPACGEGFRAPLQADAPASDAAGNATVPAEVEMPAPSSLTDIDRTRLIDGSLAPPSNPGTLAQLDRFELIRPLGRGGMGEVYLAREPVTDNMVAIKMILPEMVSDRHSVHSFLTEARHMYRLSHPNILRVMEVSARPEGPYYVMPYVQGGSLADRMEPDKPLPRDFTLHVARQVAEALEYAHSRGLIHRDLKPANVLIEENDRALLTDFGLVRSMFGDSLLDVTKQSPQGTPVYMSPSVAEGKAEDTRCDIYSFGAMLYEMLSGKRPYSGRTADAVLKQILAGPPQPLAEISPDAPAGLLKVAEGAMARELRDRYATMSDVVADLKRLDRGEIPAGPHGQVDASRRKSRVRYAIAAAAAVLLASGLALWLAAVRGRTHDAPSRPTRAASDSPWRTTFGAAEEAWQSGRYDEAAQACERALTQLDADPGTSSAIAEVHRAPIRRLRSVARFIADRDELPAELQVKAINAFYAEIDKSYDGKGDFHVDDGRITAVSLSDTGATTLDPLRGLPLMDLRFGTAGVSDLSPIRGMALRVLSCLENNVSDLSPVQGMPLEALYAWSNSITNLDALAGMPLDDLRIQQNRVRDLSPLDGAPIRVLNCKDNDIEDLSPLAGMPLEKLWADANRVADLSPLRGMDQLTELSVMKNRVRDLSPLHGLPLEALYCGENPIADLAPLQGMKLTSLDCGHTAVESLAPLEGMPLTSLSAQNTRVRDLAPLRGIPLDFLVCSSTAVTDLEPLRGMPLKTFACSWTDVSDLSPLRGAPLVELWMLDTPVTDLTPLAGMPLRKLLFSPGHVRTGLDVVRSIATLEEIGHTYSNLVSAAEFWRAYDAGELAASPPETPPAGAIASEEGATTREKSPSFQPAVREETAP